MHESSYRPESPSGGLAKKERESSVDQESIFDQEDLSVNFILNRFREFRDQRRENEAMGYSSVDTEEQDAFYLNSSDSLARIRDEIDVTGQAVLTVGGSGEFVQMFAAQGALRADVFDMSWTACLMNELKMTALRELDFDEYRKLLGFCARGDKKVPVGGNQDFALIDLVDKGVAAKLHDKLTPQANIFLQAMLDPDNRSLCSFPAWGNGFVRNRQQAYIGDVVARAADYERAQEAARTSSTSIHLSSVEQLPKELVGSYNRVYISNVGYDYLPTIKIMDSLVRRGAPSVIASFAIHDRFIKSLGSDRSPGAKFSLKDYNGKDYTAVLRSDLSAADLEADKRSNSQWRTADATALVEMNSHSK